MKIFAKSALFLPLLIAASSLGACNTSTNVIRIAASTTPHAEILTGVVSELVAEKGYTLQVSELDWTLQNDGVYQGDYDANYFQHRPYLQGYDSGDESIEFSESYTYTKVFPVAGVHFEPLRVYPGKSRAAEFESKKNDSTTTYCICNDTTNATRALDLLVDIGVLETYDIDNLPTNIVLVAENLLAASLADHDYGILPANTALTAGISADTTLPVESDSVKALRANVVAASVSRYKSDAAYKTKIDVLTDALLDDKVAAFIASTYSNVVADARVDYRSSVKLA